jgi:hypothetical protein
LEQEGAWARRDMLFPSKEHHCRLGLRKGDTPQDSPASQFMECRPELFVASRAIFLRPDRDVVGEKERSATVLRYSGGEVIDEQEV